MNIKELKNMMKNYCNHYILAPKSLEESENIQIYLMNNGFRWRGGETWVEVAEIKSYEIYHDHKFLIIFNSNYGMGPKFLNDRQRNNISNIIDFYELQNDSNTFINELFKDII